MADQIERFSTVNFSSKARTRYTIIGTLFGCSFPIVATTIDLFSQNLAFTPTNLAEIHTSQPLHWIINMAPFVLGYVASIVGSQQQKSDDLNSVLAAQLDQLNAINHEANLSASNNLQISSELVDMAQTLNQSFDEQNKNFTRAAALLATITKAAQLNSSSAVSADKQLARSTEIAAETQEFIDSIKGAMQDITGAIKNITTIIGTIDEISFQTKMLSLNASVEAAQAGDKGKGFAIVAAEVRRLADRSNGAAQEIKSLVEDSVNKANSGQGLVDKSSETLTSILAEVSAVSDRVGDIAQASVEQARELDTLNTNLSYVSEIASSSSTWVEALTDTSLTLMDHAKNLQNHIGTVDQRGHIELS